MLRLRAVSNHTRPIKSASPFGAGNSSLSSEGVGAALLCQFHPVTSCLTIAPQCGVRFRRVRAHFNTINQYTLIFRD